MNNETLDIAGLKRMLKVIGGDVNDLRELVDDFLAEAPRLSAAIARAAAEGDRDALRVASHTLKSNARDFGAMRLSALCSALENDCRAECTLDAPVAAAEIVREQVLACDVLGVTALEALA